MVKVSIISPVYNNEKYLKQCLDSILAQTLPDWEMICVNDGSTDSSLEILNQYAKQDNRFRIIDKKNEGPGVARNLAISQAKGEYLFCLDSDDWLENNALELVYNKIKQDDADILFYNYLQFFEKLQKTNTMNYVSAYSKFKNKPFTPKEAGEILFKTNALIFKVYRTKFIQENDIKYSNHKFHEDVPFYLKSMLKAKRIACLSTPIYNNRVRINSATAYHDKYTTCIPEVYDICFDILKDETDMSIVQSFLQNRQTSLLYFYCSSPIWKKHKYYKMMQKIIAKHFTKYELDDNMKLALKHNFLVYEFIKRKRKTKINLEAYKI